MLEVKNISFSYDTKPVLQDISFELPKGAHLALMGASGSGKSTLIKAIYGLLKLKGGNISWEGKELLGPEYHLIPGERFIKMVAQESDLMPYTSVEDNLTDPLSPHDIENHQQRVQELLEVIDMVAYRKQKVKNLSGGQRQRVAIAKALALQPEILLLDEPFSHIDPFQKNQLRAQLFSFVAQQGITVINATHDAQDVLPFSWMSLVLQNGKIESYGPTKQQYLYPKNEYIASFFNYVGHINYKHLNAEIEADEYLLCYPEELSVAVNGIWKTRVAQCLFMGSKYLLRLIDEKDKTLWCYSTKSVIPNTEIQLKPANRNTETLFEERYAKKYSS